MQLIKPAWVMHTDEKKKRLPIFSLHVHGDGSRLATGGLDSKVRIWSTAAILDEHNTMPKSLCTLTMHVGPVLCVRWSHSGRLLASGSDDGLVMIWDLDPSGAGKVFGEEEVNVEGWKALRRLAGHESDVSDLSWSPQDRFLASVSMDSSVIIWDDRVAKLVGHQGFVKGVCWDPVGQYLATQSDDKTVRIWRTTDWACERVVTQPFELSPASTFFRRLSWSPDGAHITAANAMNGPVFVAAVISRKEWTSDISLVGHENTVEVASYNPHLFVRDESKPVDSHNICSVLALGADDRSVSVWQTNQARPLLVALDVFDRNVLDLSWSFDGLTLYACSSDGTIAVMNFSPSELRGIAPHDVQLQYLKGYKFTSPMNLTYQAEAPQPIPLPPQFVAPAQRVQPLPAQPPINVRGTQEVTRTKDGKRRIRPVLLSQGSSTSLPPPVHPYQQPLQNGIHIQPQPTAQLAYTQPVLQHAMAEPSNPFTSTPLSVSQPGSYASSMPLSGQAGLADDDVQMVDSWEPAEPASTAGGSSPRKGRTLGGDRVREPIVVRELLGSTSAVMPIVNLPSASGATRTSEPVLKAPGLKTYVAAPMEGAKEGDVLEGRNPDEPDKPSDVQLYQNKTVQWLDYLPSRIVAVASTSVFFVAACIDGGITVYSQTGRRMLPTLMLDSRAVFLQGLKQYLLAITEQGTLAVWNVKSAQAIVPPSSIRHLLISQLLSVQLRPNGVPVLNFSDGTAFSYDPGLSCWHKLSDAWFARGSDSWDAARTRASRPAAPRGPIATLEAAISEAKPLELLIENKPEWWSAATTLAHLESRMFGAKALDSPGEYKLALLGYARRLADEGFRGKAEELIKELCGPVYWRLRKEPWEPTVLGMQKRDLLKEVLSIFARSKTLVKLGSDYQDLMKRIVVEDV
ncbi:WD40 repeat-like protein [Dacryopinax primogenitus]|uniref:Protein HIR n=1 Tax=Dacryopinax primogenitus (strain DJM 731) TaxID=1858805 RepID=M5FQX3_DACPD|nr:WD40 repeat-like protein [Dacryopinax primogenitus]EJT99410.1 WD40 repeat-like protein [Dacryopinax primogenitus]